MSAVQGPYWVDAAPVREHIATLLAAGIGYRRIAALAGVSIMAVTPHMEGYTSHPAPSFVRASTARAILGVAPSAGHVSPRRRVASVGTRRRLQALSALGWSQRELAARLGLREPSMASLMRSEVCTVRVERAARRLYDELWDQPPVGLTVRERQGIARVRAAAARRGWVSPLAWDDDSIDDPSALPDLGAPSGSSRERSQARMEDLEFLLSTGTSVPEALARAGYASQGKALDILRHRGRADLADRLLEEAAA